MDIKNIINRRARGKTKDGEWVYGYFVYVYPQYRIYGKDGTYTEVMPDTVGWYTGMDSNAKEEVYEGDYVEYVTNSEKFYPPDISSSEPKKGKAIIGYDDIGFTIKSIDGQVLDSFMLFMFYEDWHCADPDPDFRIIKVLGNRWDNPEIQVIPPKYEVEVEKLPF